MSTRKTSSDKPPRRPALTPPDAEQEQPRRGRPMLLFSAVFSLMILCGLAYFFLPSGMKKYSSPSVLQEQQVQVVETVQKEKEAPKIVEAADGKARAFSLQLRERWLQLHAEAEADEIRAWGGQTFVGIREKAAQAEQMMSGRQYEKAAAVYQDAITALGALQASRPRLLADALSSGEKALTACDGTAAVTSFTRALALDPASREAGHGLGRARTLEQVCAQYKKALVVEQQGDLNVAKEMLLRITTLDAEFQPAVQALSRVRAQAQTREFNAAMAGFLRALTEKREKAARKFLARAAKLRPQSKLVQDGRRQLQQFVVRQTLDRLHGQYRQAAASEQWRQAGDICSQALQVDSQASFALAGREKAGQRLALDRAMQNIIKYPQRLQENAVLSQARQTLAVARSVMNPGPKLKKQIVAVDVLLAGSIRPVEVVLQSDNATDVVIYRVGRLGRFNRRTVRLRPGRYTVVGSRPGFRDVRLELEIRQDDKQPQLSIRCTEVI